MRINSNIASLSAQRQMALTTRALQRSMERLASGQRINQARDDASGLAQSIGLDTQVRGLRQAVLNINQSMGYLNTADSILQTQIDLVQRMRELAVQASNGVLSFEDRQHLDTEMQELLAEFNRVTEQSEFAGTKLFDGSFETKTLQIGTEKGQTIDWGLGNTLGTGIFTVEETRGSGSFSNYSIGAGVNSYGPQVIDINGDGLLDQYHYDFSNQNLIRIQVQGEGRTWTEREITTDGSLSELININSDDIKDYYEVTAAGLLRIYLGNEDGSFTMTDSVNPGASGIYIWNGDGNSTVDFIAHDSTTGVLKTYTTSEEGQLSLVTNTTIAALPLGLISTADVVFSDNRDDALVYHASSGVVQALSNDGTGGLTFRATLNFGASSNLSVTDMNGDGQNEVVGTSNSLLRAYSANGSGAFAQTVNQATSSRATLVDLNGDDIIDFTDSSGTNRWIWYGSSSGTFTQAQTLTVTAGLSLNSTGDFNGDGKLDLIYFGSGSLRVFASSGSGVYTQTLTLNLGGNFIFSYDDLDNDGSRDIRATDTTAGSIRIYRNDGTANFTETATLNRGSSSFFNWVDLTGDGLLDIVGYGYSTSSSVSIFRADGAGAYTQMTTINLAGNSVGALTDDFDGDGIDDLVLSDVNGMARYYRSNSSLNLSLQWQEQVEGSHLVIADLDGDGRKDLFASNYTTSRSRAYLNRDGSFEGQSAVEYESGAALWGLYDLDQDGFLDAQFYDLYGDGSTEVFFQQTENYSEAADLSLLTQSDAQDALEILDRGLDRLIQNRSQIGALQNRLESARQNNLLMTENLRAASSQIRDADLALELAELTRSQILQAAQISVMGQANLSLQVFLSLLNNLDR